MENFTPSDLKTILHSKRANIYYLEHCRVLVSGGRVEYVTEEGRKSLYWNIPIANTTSILLGTGTSITQSAMRELAKAGVLVGFCGGDGTPLFAANEVQVDISWLTSQSEYRPTEYLQHWVSFWFDEEKRVEAAKGFQVVRMEQIAKIWLGKKLEREDGFVVDESKLTGLLAEFRTKTEQAIDTNEILAQEAKLTKALYKIAANTVRYGDFTRSKRGAGIDAANRFLDHGNYLAYGLGATAAWVLGLPHGLSVLHGKTRRGGLVFDIADLVKDAMVLPQAFIAATNGEDDMEFRQRCTQGFNRFGALDIMIDCLKETASALSKVGR
ncbi:type I-F CRISPR-associated endonuclease Cas1f [Desulfurivibrio alkaliphilus]|uniref:CRISPR-associated endonuclease Cas1 n=1 Tax=Desulfurivibrio alkaliphilus (strain DSM 19089 / UNIQEM U267 / AHT2) TaxID=589865 RepID=D6Z3U9_DESAT|nr:type I-F CRISPR-associated endonuclease Cas1f [Desulfurivibrio alkaliphilus]ADH86224.1 CRISPR-associated protein Cas1 [Desulfurivibrio alkaliphilus AHT 2]